MRYELAGGRGPQPASNTAPVRFAPDLSYVESSDGARWDDAAALLDVLVLGDFQEFLTIPGYRLLDQAPAR